MATPGNNTPGKKDRREAAREKARQDREVERKRVRRNKIFLQGGVGLAVIAIAAIVMLVIVNQPKPVALSTNAAGPLNMASDGILLSGPDLAAETTSATKAGGDPVATKQDDSKLNIVTYVDYQCPYCQQFEATNAQQIKDLVASGKAKPKAPKDYKLVGTSPQRKEIPDKVFGRFEYIADFKRPNMLYGRALRPPVAGAKPVSVDEAPLAAE